MLQVRVLRVEGYDCVLTPTSCPGYPPPLRPLVLPLILCLLSGVAWHTNLNLDLFLAPSQLDGLNWNVGWGNTEIERSFRRDPGIAVSVAAASFNRYADETEKCC